MITRDTAARIAFAYDEINAAKAILEVIEKADYGEPPDFRDHFGRQRGIQLGVPSGVGSHRLMDVSPKLAAIIIKAHVDAKRSEIEALCETAVGEMSEGR